MNDPPSNDDAKPPQKLPTYEALYAFLKAHYKHARFEGADGEAWCPKYSEQVTRSALAALKDHGYSAVSHHEDKAGRGFFFDAELNIMEGDALQRALRGEPR